MPEPLDDALMLAGAEAIDDMAQSFIAAAGAVLKAHGPDPNQAAIVASAFMMALDRIGKVEPLVPQIVQRALNKRHPIT